MVAKKLFLYLALSSVSAFYDSVTPPVPMSSYTKPFRTLSCSECFAAAGKMCILKNNANMISYTGSSNRGHGYCCKPDYTGDHCDNSDTMICS